MSHRCAVLALVALPSLLAAAQAPPPTPAPKPSPGVTKPSPPAPKPSSAAARPGGGQVDRGRYLSIITGCHDCHTPKTMGPNGPEPDMSRALSGFPADTKLPPPPSLAMPWIAATDTDLAAWSGAWGISYATNLTPDENTGLGIWTEAMFVKAMRTGKHMGASRPILPPMPWHSIGQMTDPDLKALFAYLRSIPPISNRIPEPTPPAGPPPPSR